MTIASASARLACYDALARRAGDAPAAMSVATPPATPAGPAATATATATATAGSTESADAIQNFGLSSAQRHAPPQGPESIQAHVAEFIVDQLQRNYVVLDNGQTWASTDGGMLLDAGELVTVSRGALGSFMLKSTTSRHSYHVRRVR
jgi:phospholipase A1